MLERVLKIQLFTFVGLLVIYRRIHVIALIWVLVLSIGYYGVKGRSVHFSYRRKPPSSGRPRFFHHGQRRSRWRW